MGINRLLCQAQSKSGRMLIEKIQEPQNPQSICEDCLGLFWELYTICSLYQE